MRFTVAPFLLGASLVHLAVGQDNFTAADPLTEDDIGIVSGIDTYQPEQHDCPLNCVDYSNPHSWIPYFSVQRLRRCDEPMLLQLSVSQPLDDPDSTVLIRACSVGSQNSTDDTSTGEPMENPKNAKNLFQASLKVSPACEIKGTPINSKLQLGTSGDETSNKTLVANAVSLLKGMEKFFDARDNCNEKFLFAHYQQTVASIYIGPGLGKPTAKLALDAFAKHIQTMDAVSNYTVAEFCGQGREAEQVFGIAVDTTGNLASVQKATLQWIKGDCTINDDFRVAGHLAGVEVFDLAGNGTLRRNETSSGQEKRSSSLLDHRKHGKRSTLNARATCRYIQIVDGDSCQSLAARCGIRGSDFTKFNPKTNMCSTLKSGDYVCCSAGDPYTPPKPDAPKPNADGTCATHLIDNGDSCDSLAEINGITVKDIENWNQNKTWAWTECKDMLVGDYIVYMTYDLHGQWDYGNPNAFDMCLSGKCIRSHVNLTETRNALAMITKSGVPNNKIYVGEASYGRSFRMAQDGCWGPMCEFTSSKIESNANPGRCTDTGGYLAYAEILEILLSGDSNARRISDEDSDSDIILYKVSYMTPTTKDKRREEWKGLNFAGNIDWAVDLQLFTKADFDDLPDRPASGEGCIDGTDIGGDTLDLCEFTCTYGFCPESVCECFGTGPLKTLPSENKKANFVADSLDVDVNRLCKFACKYGYCPDQICIPEESETNDDDAVEPVEDEVDAYDYNDARYQNAKKCWIYKEINQGDDNLDTCKIFCKPQLDEAEEEGRISNYGCIGRFPLGEEIPWRKDPFRGKMVAPGECNCDNMLLNELATTVLEAMPVIAQIGCYILMQSFKLILDIGIEFATRGTGKALDAAVDMLATAGQMASYIYPEGENPEDAFSWWLSPCGGTDLVPDEVKQVFDILGMIPSGKTSFKPPKDIKKGSGKKGDDGNPDNTRGVRKTGGGSKGGNSRSQRKCTTVPPSKRLARSGPQSNTLRFFTCKNDATHTTEYVITTLTYAPNARPSAVTSECKDRWPQPCYHYSSAIKENPRWETLSCPPDAAVTSKPRPKPPPAVAAYEREHRSDWRDKSHRTEPTCHGDEFPPLYFLTRQDPEYAFAGINKRGQRIRYLPGTENSGAASLWKSFCFKTPLEALSDTNLQSRITSGNGRTPPTVITPKRDRVSLGITVDIVPEFSMTYEHAANPPRDAGLWDNPCWASGIAAGDPGFALFELDEWYDKNPKGPGGRRTKWNYAQPYVQGQNGD